MSTNGSSNEPYTSGTASASPQHSNLIPSQAIQRQQRQRQRQRQRPPQGAEKNQTMESTGSGPASISHSRGNKRTPHRKNESQRRRGNGNKLSNHSPGPSSSSSSQATSTTGNDANIGGNNETPSSRHGANPSNKRRGNRGRKPKAPPTNGASSESPTTTIVSSNRGGTAESEDVEKSESNSNRNNNSDSQRRKNGRNRKRQNQRKLNQQKRFPWRKHIPDEAVDPITLEPLHSLPYPPFVLFAKEPYITIEVWPFPETSTDSPEQDVEEAQETEEQRQQRILEEQWGNQLSVREEPQSDVDKQQSGGGSSCRSKSTTPSKDRHVHLYDGRALAYYMVSQLQFIDPLNRRDLVRDEIVNLDQYLRRHGFHNLNVAEAYDAKGVTISTAGAAGNTAAGRAAILQQEAAVLLNALFGGPSSLPNRSTSRNSNDTNNNHSLMASYQAHEHQQEEQRLRQQTPMSSRNHNAHQTPSIPQHSQDDSGIYGDIGGILVIDDDLNPGLRGDTTRLLRGDAAEFVPSTNPTSSTTTPFTLWSSSHIASQFSHQADRKAADFPALTPPTASSSTPASKSNHRSSNKKVLPKSQTLSKIAVSVKKTDPEERRRMQMAHEKWQRRTMMSNLTFGVDPIAPVASQAPSSVSANANILSSPPEPTEAQLERNRAFANALDVKPATLRKAESGSSLKSSWSRPTVSDGLDEYGRELTEASYPDELILQARERLGLLTKLERRWKLFLEDDKAASLPLWPMDRPARAFVHEYSDYWRLNTESFDPEPKRYIHCVKLLDTRSPRTLLSEAARCWKGPSTGKQLLDLEDLPRASKASSSDHHLQQTAGQATTQTVISQRWEGLGKTSSPPRERPKLELQKRTLPLELPPFEPPTTATLDYFNSEERKLRQERMEEKARKEREQVEAKRRALQDAFASDDEDDNNGKTGSNGDDDSEWTQEEEQYESDSDSV